MDIGHSWITWFFHRLLRLPQPQDAFDTNVLKAVSRIIVVGKFPNPTFDYYFAARLAAPGMPPFELVDIRDRSPLLDADGAMVVIVRYTSIRLSRWVAKHKRKLASVVLFVDDDIASAITSPEANLGYRYRLISQAIMPLKLLNRTVDELWVSTEVLKQRLAYASPRVLPPAPGADTLSHALQPFSSSLTPKKVKIAYHATSIHVEEHNFLRPIIKAVLEARPYVLFEVIAEGRIADAWRKIDANRVIVKPPLPWKQYVHDQTEQIDVMLVPVAPSQLNDCRAETKRIDVVRVQAAALLSDCPAFRPAHACELLLPYEKTTWVSHILSLVDNEYERSRVAAATRERVKEMQKRALDGLPLIARRMPDANP